MMAEKLFLSILNMSVTASWVILVILAVRMLLRRFPAKYSYALWAAVGFRLLCPFSVSTVFSLFNLKNFVSVRVGNQMEYVPADIGFAQQPRIDLGAAAVSEAVGNSLPAANAMTSVNPLQIWIFLGSRIWIMGMAVLFICALIQLVRTRKMVSRATLFWENAGAGSGRRRTEVYECENIPSPFVLGIFRPKIYIPYRLNRQEREYILAHERFHIRRRDHWVKILAFLLLSIYWFDPLVWLSYFLMCKDMEMSCDETVITRFGKDAKKEYSSLLLSFSSDHRHLSPGPLAFGESDVAQRIKNVLRFQSPKVWMSILGAVIVVAIAAVCVTNGKEGEPENTEEETAADSLQEDMPENAADSMQEDVPEAAGGTDETVSASMIKDQLMFWANAFCERDGQTILEMCTEEVKDSFEERELLTVGEGGGSFGMSSPWPWQPEADYLLLEPEGDTAEILYYAQASDPHVWVWRETIQYQVLDEKILVESEELRIMEHISSTEEFLLAYPYGIDGTEMDYLSNGMGEALNSNALLSSSRLYEDLLQPDRAAISLLNLLDNSGKVQIREHAVRQEGSVEIQIYFAEDGGTVNLLMVQPFGENGIWIPQDMYDDTPDVQAEERYSNYREYEKMLGDGF